MTSMAPDWAETTVRWLRTNYPTHVTVSSSLTFSVQMGRALKRMNYLRRELIDDRGFSESKLASSLDQYANEWSEARHKKLVSWLKKGGYSPPVGGLEKLSVAVTDASGKVVGVETLGLDGDDIDSLVDALPPKAQMSPSHELEEILAEVELTTDSRFGVW